MCWSSRTTARTNTFSTCFLVTDCNKTSSTDFNVHTVKLEAHDFGCWLAGIVTIVQFEDNDMRSGLGMCKLLHVRLCTCMISPALGQVCGSVWASFKDYKTWVYGTLIILSTAISFGQTSGRWIELKEVASKGFNIIPNTLAAQQLVMPCTAMETLTWNTEGGANACSQQSDSNIWSHCS